MMNDVKVLSAAKVGRSRRRGKTVFLYRHGLCPKHPIGRDHGDDPLKVVTRKSLGLEYLPDFLSFAFRHQRDVFLLDAEDAIVVVALGFGADVVRCCHGEAVGKEIGKSEQQYHPCGKVCASNACHDRECRYRAVDSAIDPVAEVIAPRAAR
jgi:hypothetical protein